MSKSVELKLQLEILPFANISLCINDISFIRLLVVENIGDADSAAVDIQIHSDIPFIQPFHYQVAFVPAGKELKIPLENLKVSRSFLDAVSESERATITVSLMENGEVILTEEASLMVHPLEHFSGFAVLPELLASYVTPNHPYVYHIKRSAVDILERRGLHPAFEGYQSDSPERVLQMMSALYTAIQKEEIVYSALPPGYEHVGQRLRLLSTIQRERFGNCIDNSLLWAACLEAINLHPVIIVTKGHAFVGCWLNEDKFSEVVNDDKTAITKRLARGIRELAVVEATSVCKGHHTLFTDAANMAESQLVGREDFVLSVDVKRARSAGIRPLPLTISRDAQQEEATNNGISGTMEEHFDIGTIYEDELGQERKPLTKQKVWERKLLDLSLRNNLLNIRMTRNMLQLVDIDISQLEDTLSEGKSFSIMPDMRADMLKRYNTFVAALHHSSPVYQMANDELRHHRLLTHYHQVDLDNVLPYIHKNAKQAIEENGASTLYLAVGLLKWYDRKTPDIPRYAPILLLPVEISRRSVNSKFTLKGREEEAMVNITLLEFLRQEYELNLSMLEDLPVDEKGVDVAKVMGIFRRAVMQLKGWDVEEQLILGNFSFSKLILWKDIVAHQEQLLQNGIVRSLVEGRLVLEDVDEHHDHATFDHLHPAAIALPIPTDVSQMDAVFTAQQGKSFILHGPPGTGKSQTITNIIADALYQGKKVLFVAAKKAALDVVYKRMEQIGLAPFSLELHSNKSRKSDVLEQLARSLDTAKRSRAFDYDQEAERLHAIRNDISSYVAALHRVQPIGWSLYESIAALEQYDDGSFSRVIIPDAAYGQLDAALWQRWEDWLPIFRSIAGVVVHPQDNPLRALRLPHYSPQVQEDLTLRTAQLLDVLERHIEQVPVTTTAAHFPFKIESYEQWVGFQEMSERLLSLPDMPISLATYLADRENVEIYEEWNRVFGEYQADLGQLLDTYHRKLLEVDLSTFELQWMQAGHEWFFPKWWRRRGIKKQLAAYRKVPFVDDTQVEDLFTLHGRLQDAQRTLRQSRYEGLQRALKSLYRGDDTDLLSVRQKADAVKQLRERVYAFGTDAFSRWMQAWKALPWDYVDEWVQSGKTSFSNFILQAKEIQEAVLAYESASGMKLHGEDTEGGWLQHTVAQLKSIQLHLPQLKDWMNYLHVKGNGDKLHLQWLLTAFEGKLMSIGTIEAFFYYTVHRCMVENVIASQEAFSMFNADLFTSKIAQYKKIAKDFRELTKQELFLRLSSRLPNTTVEAMQSSEIGILRRAIKNRGRGISIRKLFDQIPTLLPRIAPCMLMSPISAAQYFDVDTEHFDLVIFDEASQLPTCEAVSALARAKQAVIVGDPKQMPPTSFFSSNRVDEENMDVEDLESILDDCLALSMPSRYLLRHYRSKHESLIAFSNANYYDNKLLTFPSADDLSRKVVHHPVQGFYDKGKTRQNSYEADAIVAYIEAHCRDEHRRKYSLGVVTFSQTQQNLIEDKLQELLMMHPDLEQMAHESAEPIFIKNLENVQGDERDIILFSIGYAPDQQDKMSMNFGPLNRNGGWRRLNVAVTRSRYEMHVFSTLVSDRIDLSRTASEGVAGLKAFLHFAERGQLTLRPQDMAATLVSRSLSDGVVRRLIDRGLTAKRDIGTSGFKVDVGVVHPDKPNQYVLGILIDGKYYFDAHTANDREMVMPEVLMSLGWNIYRIWAMDWLDHADKIVDAIVAHIDDLKKQGYANAYTEVLPVAEEPKPASVHQFVAEEIPEVSALQKPYAATKLAPVRGGSSERIYEQQSRYRIEAQITEVVDTEGPISKTLLQKRVLQAWNISRAGARLDFYLDDIIKDIGLKYRDHHQRFYWATDAAPTHFSLDYYRTNDLEKRDMPDIAPEELVLAITEAVQHNLSIEEEELFRYVARVFGFAKVGRQIEEYLRYALDLAEQQGKIVRENGRVKVGGNI